MTFLMDETTSTFFRAGEERCFHCMNPLFVSDSKWWTQHSSCTYPGLRNVWGNQLNLKGLNPFFLLDNTTMLNFIHFQKNSLVVWSLLWTLKRQFIWKETKKSSWKQCMQNVIVLVPLLYSWPMNFQAILVEEEGDFIYPQQFEHSWWW